MCFQVHISVWGGSCFLQLAWEPCMGCSRDSNLEWRAVRCSRLSRGPAQQPVGCVPAAWCVCMSGVMRQEDSVPHAHFVNSKEGLWPQFGSRQEQLTSPNDTLSLKIPSGHPSQHHTAFTVCQALSSVSSSTHHWGCYYYHPHFTDGEKARPGDAARGCTERSTCRGHICVAGALSWSSGVLGGFCLQCGSLPCKGWDGEAGLWTTLHSISAFVQR